MRQIPHAQTCRSIVEQHPAAPCAREHTSATNSRCICSPYEGSCKIMRVEERLATFSLRCVSQRLPCKLVIRAIAIDLCSYKTLAFARRGRVVFRRSRPLRQDPACYRSRSLSRFALLEIADLIREEKILLDRHGGDRVASSPPTNHTAAMCANGVRRLFEDRYTRCINVRFVGCPSSVSVHHFIESEHLKLLRAGRRHAAATSPQMQPAAQPPAAYQRRFNAQVASASTCFEENPES